MFNKIGHVIIQLQMTRIDTIPHEDDQRKEISLIEIMHEGMNQIFSRGNQHNIPSYGVRGG